MLLPSFQDTPIETSEEDTMGIGTYTKSLTKFITSCQAPMTVGLQGNWGTGKTSLMKLLKSELHDKGVHSIWVNTWEHSVFVDAEQTTPQILLAMADELKRLKKRDDVNLADKVKNHAGDLFFVGKNALNQFMKEKIGVDVEKAKEDEHHSVKTSPVGRIRETMSWLVTNVVGSEKNTTEKVVFFIDDLDRIKPSVAVDVIEALKNVFDEIPHCVFILAIDYEVIKKGLKERYGDEQDADREFKSFFDKMIQVPFRMPTAAMNVKGFIETNLKQLGIDGKDEYFEKYASVLMTSIGHNPRSLKRFFNTYSLQQNIMKNILDEPGKSGSVSDTNFLLALLNALEIAFPKSWGLFLEDHEIDNWVEEIAGWKEEDRKDLLLELNLELSVFDERDQNGVFDFVNHDKVPALFQQLKMLLDDLRKAANNNLDEVLSIVKITSSDDTSKVNDKRKRDNTKFEFDGKKLAKNRYVLAVLRACVEEHPDMKFEEFQELIPQSVTFHRMPLWKTLADAEEHKKVTKYQRYFLKEEEQIKLSDGSKLCVTNQWALDTVTSFRDFFETKGIRLE